MTYARFYQHGVKAYGDGRGLGDNPHERDAQGPAFDGWRDGWIDAYEAHARRSALDFAAARRIIRIDRFIAAREQSQA